MSIETRRLENEFIKAWSGVSPITEAEAAYFLADEFPWLANRISNKSIANLDLFDLEYGEQLFPLEVPSPQLQVLLIGAVALSLLKCQEASSKRDRLENVFYVIYNKYKELLSAPQENAIRHFLRNERKNVHSSLRDVPPPGDHQIE